MNDEQKVEFKAIYNSLTQEQKDHLMSNFDRMESCILEYDSGKFLGCHLAAVESHYLIKGQSEFWAYGFLKNPTGGVSC